MGSGELAVSKLVTPMDFALAGMTVWRRQMQSTAVMAMRMSGLGASWAMPPSEAMELVARNQANIVEASRKMTLLMMEGAVPALRGTEGGTEAGTGGEPAQQR